MHELLRRSLFARPRVATGHPRSLRREVLIRRPRLVARSGTDAADAFARTIDAHIEPLVDGIDTIEGNHLAR